MKKTRKYDREFRINAVKHYESSGKSLREVGANLGVPISTLSGWVKEYKDQGEKAFPGSGNIKPCNEEYYKLLKAYEDGERYPKKGGSKADEKARNSR